MEGNNFHIFPQFFSSHVGKHFNISDLADLLTELDGEGPGSNSNRNAIKISSKTAKSGDVNTTDVTQSYQAPRVLILNFDEIGRHWTEHTCYAWSPRLQQFDSS